MEVEFYLWGLLIIDIGFIILFAMLKINLQRIEKKLGLKWK
jgi:hypothetical protein